MAFRIEKVYQYKMSAHNGRLAKVYEAIDRGEKITKEDAIAIYAKYVEPAEGWRHTKRIRNNHRRERGMSEGVNRRSDIELADSGKRTIACDVISRAFRYGRLVLSNGYLIRGKLRKTDGR